MKRAFVPFVVLAMGFAPAPVPRRDPNKEALDALQGAWQLIRHKSELEGRPGIILASKMVIAQNHMRCFSGKGACLAVLAFTLDARTTPGRIDMRRLHPPDDGPYLGLYRLQGDRLSICYRQGKRPGSFDSSEPGVVVEIYKREPAGEGR
jgi:uncharacterized protein (TIGR03067 family)